MSRRQQRDAAGLAVTCAGPEALEAFNRVLWAGVSYVEYLFPLAERAVELDEGLVLAHCLLGYLQLSSFHPASSPQVSGHVKMAKTALEGGTLTEREERHVQALLAYAEGQLPSAIDHWAAILVNYPRDLIAVRILFVSCIMVGNFEKMRNVLAGVLPRWDEDMPSYPFILGLLAYAEGQLPSAIDHWAAILVNYPRDLLATHMLFVACKMLGMFARARDTQAALLPHWEKKEPLYPYLLAFYAFGLEETKYYGEAEKAAREAIGMQRKTPFAFHVMELGDTEAVLNEYDTILVKSVTPDNRLGLLDASSLLWRLNLMGVDVGNRWQRITDSLRIHIGKHGSSW
jgi:tetratricopeptide (TPR) repeat protein